jgi:hypothetical protein
MTKSLPPVLECETSRHSVTLLLQALERNDRKNLDVLSRSVLRNAYDHLLLGYPVRTKENGAAMASLLVLQGGLDRHEQRK